MGRIGRTPRRADETHDSPNIVRDMLVDECAAVRTLANAPTGGRSHGPLGGNNAASQGGVTDSDQGGSSLAMDRRGVGAVCEASEL